MTAAEARERLGRLHAAVDAAAAGLVSALPGVLACGRGCAACCVDDLTVFPVEAELIRHHHAELLDRAEPRAPGGCAFLAGNDTCRIYAHRPYVCRTQGLPLRWDGDDGGEGRDICPLNVDPLGVPLGGLKADQCWELGPWEGRLASLAAERQGSFELRRVSLRGLFAASLADEPDPAD